MRLTLLLPFLAALLPTPIRGDACVAGGPAAQITAVKACCLYIGGGTWYQFYPVQAICVLNPDRLRAYKECVADIPGTLDTKCIPGDGGLGGPSSSATPSATPSSTSSSATVVYTPRRF